MKNLFVLFGLLLLVGCDQKEDMVDNPFAFKDEIQAIIAIGKGTEAENPLEIKNDDGIHLFVDAMQDAERYQGPVTDIGAEYELEVTYRDDSTETIYLWFFSNMAGLFEVNDEKYLLNEKAIPKLITMFDK
ncbi:hypothetical protein [Sporosarcina sp. Te-1]|uniref:hypothetical protein n=1 Tax=Sporosarcina sp. Te-1 TaxID=2818390 RepID=UPI001A9E831F|nr:hypothetical protein [Sporosarcina sp. Te-1]QTD40250.1 hypothetical protein J3U78_15770 [Sporosarcina sp. Te-1]